MACPPCVSRSATRSRQLSCRAGCRGAGRSKTAFCLGERTPRSERGELPSGVRNSDADRSPGGSYGGGVPLSVMLAGRRERRVPPRAVFFFRGVGFWKPAVL